MTRHVKLGDLVVAHYGKALKEAARNSSGAYAVYGSSGEVGRHDEALVDFPTIVVGRKGSVGTVTYAPAGGWPIDTTFYLEVGEPDLVELRYLYWALSRAGLDNRAITTSIPGLNRDELYRTRIRLPPLAEQRRIAAVLDKADAVRRKRCDSIRLLDRFLRSAYAALVGHRNSQYPQWAQCQISQLADPDPKSIRTGPFGSSLKHSEFGDRGVAVLGIDNAVQNRFVWAERRFISEEKYAKFKRYTVRPGDVIITIMGTTGRSAVVPEDIPPAISTKHLAVITVDRSKVHPLFLSHAIHCDPTVLAQIAMANRGAIMSGLNLGIVKRLRLRIPPLPAQERFADLVGKITEARDCLALAAQEADQFFDSLSKEAFRGAASRPTS